MSDFDLFFEKFTHLTEIGDGEHVYVEGDGSNVVELANAKIDNEELRQWMSDACDFLHDLLSDVPRFNDISHEYYINGEEITELLRRAENP